DRVPAINPETRVIAEALDEFASEGVTFRRAYVQGNESFASHAALFSGQYPATTGVHSSADHLNDGPELIAELARRAGLTTGGYSSNGHIRDSNGFEQGFQTFVNTLRDNYRYKAPGMLSHAQRWVDEHAEERFYFYLGTVDCHVTYRSHEDILPLYDSEPYDGLFRQNVSGDELGRIKSGSLSVNARDMIRIEAIYDDTVTFTDRHFGMLMEHLESMGILDDTLVIVTADHGDEFWEHGSVGHGHNVYDELVHVPLLMRYPGGLPAGVTVEVGVDSVDVISTIADLLGLEPDEGAQGRSLVPLAYGVGAEYPQPAFSQMAGRRFTMSLADWKVVWDSSGGRELYNTRTDPTSQTDVASENPVALRFISDSMGLFLPFRDEWKKRTWGVASNLSSGAFVID
ncbi:MAG: sulfatase, partial [Myxococcales bacterium]|nr:sulfatase [Myxococcales bacterium]